MTGGHHETSWRPRAAACSITCQPFDLDVMIGACAGTGGRNAASPGRKEELPETEMIGTSPVMGGEFIRWWRAWAQPRHGYIEGEPAPARTGGAHDLRNSRAPTRRFQNRGLRSIALLLESELFGACPARSPEPTATAWAFEAANRGTGVLDETARSSRFKWRCCGFWKARDPPVGSSRPRKWMCGSSAHQIAITAQVDEENFRETVCTGSTPGAITIPPLCERAATLPLLARFSSQ